MGGGGRKAGEEKARERERERERVCKQGRATAAQGDAVGVCLTEFTPPPEPLSKGAFRAHNLLKMSR